MGDLFALSTQHARVLQPPFDLAQASSSVALLPILGSLRRGRSPRKHGPVHVGQLFNASILARLAPKLEPLDRTLPLHPLGRQRRIADPRPLGQSARGPELPDGLHVRGAVA